MNDTQEEEEVKIFSSEHECTNFIYSESQVNIIFLNDVTKKEE